jgi:hypothetical protein
VSASAVIRPVASARAALFWAPFAVFALLGILWSLASPVFSVPDENAHATKAIAQVRGQVVGYTLPDVRHIVVDLPEGYAYSQNTLCYATRPDISAGCASEFGSEGQPWFNTWVGAYNPVYYYLVGWPSLLFDGNSAVIAMRIASSLLGAALLAWGFLAAASGARSRWMPIGVAFAAAPMSMYLIGAVNPNGAELAAAVVVWAGVLRLLDTFRSEPERPWLSRTALWAGVTVGSIVLVNARALGPLWLVVVVGLCLLASGWAPVKRMFTTGASYWWLAAIAVGGLFSLGWTLSGGSLSGQAEKADAPLVGGTFWQGVTHTMRMTPDYVQQAIGYFGWFDSPLPVWTYWLFVAAFAVVIVLAFVATRRRSVLVLSAVGLAAVLVPALVQGYSVHQTGIIWQGRYALFLYLGVTIVAGWVLSRDAPRVGYLAERVAWVAGSLLAGYGVLAFFLVLVRYVIAKAPLGRMLSAPEWQPPLGWIALMVGYVFASGLLVVLVGLATRWIMRREGRDPRDALGVLHGGILETSHVETAKGARV